MKLIAELEQSELTQKEFAAKHDVSLNTLQYWLYKRNKGGSNFDVNSRARFLPVEVVASPAPQAPEGTVEVTVQGGAQLRFPIGTDVRYVAELLAALR